MTLPIHPSHLLSQHKASKDFSRQFISDIVGVVQLWGFLPADHILNIKSEFHQAPIVRVVTTNGLQTEQDEEEVVVRGRGGGRRAERGQ